MDLGYLRIFCFTLLCFCFLKTVSGQTPGHSGVEYPQFPGDLNAYISRNIRYRPVANPSNCDDRVVLKFTVCADGTVIDPKILHPACPELQREVLRLIKPMPRWSPGRRNGMPVDMEVKLPFQFCFLGD